MITVWPQYLDKNLSLNEGRKVSKEIAVEEPKLQDIEKALRRLNLPYSTQKRKVISLSKWYEKSGRILVESDKPKLELLKEISLKLQEIKQ